MRRGSRPKADGAVVEGEAGVAAPAEKPDAASSESDAAPGPSAAPAQESKPSAEASNPARARARGRGKGGKKGKVFLEDKGALLDLVDAVAAVKDAVIALKAERERGREAADAARKDNAAQRKKGKKAEVREKALVGLADGWEGRLC